MKTVLATFVAMTVAWALPLIGMAVGQLVTSGRTSDVLSSAFWVGVFALIAWAAVVLPVVSRFKEKKIFHDIRTSWLGWTLLAVATYSLIIPTIFGKEMFIIIWYPAIMGCIAGVTFALLVRKSYKPKNA